MSRISLLDKTLHLDCPFFSETVAGSLENLQNNAGYEFTQTAIVENLLESGVEFIDLGFLSKGKGKIKPRLNSLLTEFQEDCALLNASAGYREGLAKFVLSVTAGLDTLEEIEENLNKRHVDCVRIITTKCCGPQAQLLGKQLAHKGLEIFLQPIALDSFTGDDFVLFLSLFKNIPLKTLYLSDEKSLALNNIKRLYPYVDSTLIGDAVIGISAGPQGEDVSTYLESIERIVSDRGILVDGSCLNKSFHDDVYVTSDLALYVNNRFGKYNVSSFQKLAKQLSPVMLRTKAHYQAVVRICGHDTRLAHYFHSTEVPLWEVFNLLVSVSPDFSLTMVKEEVEQLVRGYRRDKLNLAVIVPTHNRSDEILYFLKITHSWLEEYGIELIVYDSSLDDKTLKVVESFNSPNIIYDGNPNGEVQKTLDDKVFALIDKYSTKYRYIWPVRDRSIPILSVLYSKLSLAVELGKDIIAVHPYPYYVAPEENTTVFYTEQVSFLRDVFGQMLSLGATIYSSEIAAGIAREEPVDPQKNYGLWVPPALYSYIADKKFSACYIKTICFLSTPMRELSFWIQSNTVLWLWLKRWPEIVQHLPEVYDSEKKDLLKFKGWDIVPISPLLFLHTRAGGGLRLKDALPYLPSIGKVSNITVIEFLLYCTIPRFLARKIVFTASRNRLLSKLLGLAQSISKRSQEIRRMFSVYPRRAYSGFNYDAYEDNIGCQKEWKSIPLVSGGGSSSSCWLTVGIVVDRNIESFKEALSSVLRQKSVAGEWEVVIIDNESFTGVPNKIQTYIEKNKHPKVTYYRSTRPLTPSGLVNRCVELAKGEWVALLDAKDLLASNYLYSIEKILQRLQSNKADNVAYILPDQKMFFLAEEKEQSEAVFRDIATNDYIISCVENDEKHLERYRKSTLLYTDTIPLDTNLSGVVLRKSAFIQCDGLRLGASLPVANIYFLYRLLSSYSAYYVHNPLVFRGYSDLLRVADIRTTLATVYDFREFLYSKSWFTKIIGFFIRQEQCLSSAKQLFALAQELEEVKEAMGCSSASSAEIMNSKISVSKFKYNPYDEVITIYDNKIRHFFMRGLRFCSRSLRRKIKINTG